MCLLSSASLGTSHRRNTHYTWSTLHIDPCERFVKKKKLFQSALNHIPLSRTVNPDNHDSKMSAIKIFQLSLFNELNIVIGKCQRVLYSLLHSNRQISSAIYIYT